MNPVLPGPTETKKERTIATSVRLVPSPWDRAMWCAPHVLQATTLKLKPRRSASLVLQGSIRTRLDRPSADHAELGPVPQPRARQLVTCVNQADTLLLIRLSLVSFAPEDTIKLRRVALIAKAVYGVKPPNPWALSSLLSVTGNSALLDSNMSVGSRCA